MDKKESLFRDVALKMEFVLERDKLEELSLVLPAETTRGYSSYDKKKSKYEHYKLRMSS